MTLGLTIKRPEQENNPLIENNDFKSPPPSFIPSKETATEPPIKNSEPAKPILQKMSEDAKAEGNNILSAILAKADQAIHSFKGAACKISHSNALISSSPPPALPYIPTTDNDILSDDDFIRKTMGGDIHQPEQKRYFYANGGKKFLDTGLLYAQAFSLLRKEKIERLRINKLGGRNKSNQIKRVIEERSYVSGVPTYQDRLNKAYAEKLANKREDDARWLSLPLSRRKKGEK
jgi:hypothetical protein